MIKDYIDFISNKNLNLDSFVSKKEELSRQIKSLTDINDFASDDYVSATQMLARTEEVIQKIKSFKELITKVEEAEELLDDEDFKALANEEIENSTKELDSLQSELTEFLFEPLKNDELKAILEFRPGVGGVEASLFAESLFRMYTRYCNSLGLKLETISIDYATEGGIKEASFLIKTDGAYGKLRFEGGIHRVQRIPSTESSGRIHTSTASIAVMPFFDKKNIQIKEDDLRIDVFRSSGPGGQSVNTTDSAVRITHIPTGIVISSQNGKSQHKNKDMAMSILASKLQEIEDQKRESEEKDLRTEMLQDGDRSAKIRTYNFQQSRVTDHRIKESWFNIDEIMNGEIDDIVKTVSREIRSMISK
ncbi:MAG: peptide chain release factor 1 [Candidatus Dojkabacteria bacterium]|nr:peptide chain release factor 1 [Candidatus Dojkabacteria bacterium]MDQ7021710.1 peptide chain release factor 1 [Candidatus Dojkabacteria bacterium]